MLPNTLAELAALFLKGSVSVLSMRCLGTTHQHIEHHNQLAAAVDLHATRAAVIVPIRMSATSLHLTATISASARCKLAHIDRTLLLMSAEENNVKGADEREVSDEELKLHQEDMDSIQERLEGLMHDHLGEFPVDDESPIAVHAAEIARSHITDGTRKGHQRVIMAYLAYHLKRDPSWDPMAVTGNTPKDIREFILQKCGRSSDGYEGRKYSTAVATRAALTLWYRSIRPDESSIDWHHDRNSGTCRGLPTRSRLVSEFMVGLEKTKAKAGEVSKSARALSREDMHRLHDLCLDPKLTAAEQRKGVVRYAVYLMAFLMMLRIEEALSLEFSSINKIPGERTYFDVRLVTRKSAQTGVPHVWRLWSNDGDPKMCPIRAFIRLSMVYGPEDRTGPLFLKLNQFGAVTSESMTNPVLSRALADDLQALGYADWSLFGTHSFRRGGCQYRIHVMKWSVDMVAAWGGWSQIEAITMFRYFYSPQDNHEFMIEYDNNRKRMKGSRE
ncbi:hypothetical protein HWV62_25838 [Athelia sp. TMB]|nr:hypothetical protein HWV62_25838 [Athelia sp. TMB]